MKVSEVSEKIANSLRNLPALKKVTASNATEYKQILSEIAELGANFLPAAIVTAGTGRDNRDGTYREQGFGVVIVNRFNARRAERDESIWELFNQVEERFAFPFESIEGIDVQKGDFYPLELESAQFAAVVLELKARY